MRVLVCGSRRWSNPEAIEDELKKLPPGTIIVTGGNPRVDAMVQKIAEKLGLPLEIYKADWSRYGRAAGPLRNKLMLEKARPDLLPAFPQDRAITRSIGTWNTIHQARQACVPVRIYEPWRDQFGRVQPRWPGRIPPAMRAATRSARSMTR